MTTARLNYLINTAKIAFADRPPFYNVRLPNPLDKNSIFESSPFVAVSALWTRDGFRPQWDNLAVVVDELPNQDYVLPWRLLLDNLTIPLAVLSLDNGYICLSRSASGEIETQLIQSEDLSAELERHHEALFSPRALGTLRKGQLSFADMEESVTEQSFSFYARHNANLNQSLKSAIEEALRVEWEDQKSKFAKDKQTTTYNLSTYDAVLMVAIAFLAARILEDKGFFGTSSIPTDSPQVLLERTVPLINGFFKKALLDELPQLSEAALQHLAVHLGSRAIFTLVDHRHVARLYEQAIQIIPPWLGEGGVDYRDSILNLQQHYTPTAIAERMIERLPLERLRPEERRILDPAAGSGSLLIAATRRLAAMSDIPDEKDSYLTTHIAGNDIDKRANLITQLRYRLERESEGLVFPAPLHFGNKSFESYTRDNLPIGARVIVANPPFAEDKNIQRAAKFVELVTSWLREGDQFALILPQIFLGGITHRVKQARRHLTESCHLFEVWQLPEGVIGLVAQQPVCVVLGVMGEKPRATIARAIISRALKSSVKEDGFLGGAWVTQITENESWSSAIAPPIEVTIPTVRLGELFHIFTGVNLNKNYPPIEKLPEGVQGKSYWKREWREGRLWADPDRVVDKQRYIRYGNKYLSGARLKNAYLFDKPKILLGRVANRDSADPLGAHLDDSGLWPDANVFCISPLDFTGKQPDSSKAPLEWPKLSYEERLLWLLGILSSDLAKELSLRKRESRHFVMRQLKEFELPAQVDREIIEITRAMLERDKERQNIPDPDQLREKLNSLVNASYGNPAVVEITTSAALESWTRERQHPAIIVTGQVLEVAPAEGRVLLSLDGTQDDRREAWVSLPPELPGWAVDGQVFTAEISDDIETFEDLSRRPWALRHFKHTPRPYLTADELKEKFAGLK